MSETPERDWASVLHIAAGCLLVLAVGIARLFGWFDVGGGASMALVAFPMLIFLLGRPRGRRAWLLAGASAMLIVAMVGFGVPGIRAMAGERSGFAYLPAFATLLLGPFSVGIVREWSGPDPERSAGAPKEWKPVTARAVLTGLTLGLAVAAATFWFWWGWIGGQPEIEIVAGLVASFLAFGIGGVAAVTTIHCRPSDLRSGLLSILAGATAAALTVVGVLIGMTVIQALRPDWRILQAMSESIVFMAVILLPLTTAVGWILGRRPAMPPEAEGDSA